MTTSLATDSAPLRLETWKEILDIVEGVRQMELGGATRPLAVASDVKPRLPTAEDCIRNLNGRMKQPIPTSLLDTLRIRIDHLRQRMLFNYTKLVSQMVSLSEHTGQNDLELQKKHSRSLETWFEQAIEQLFEALQTQPGIRIPVSLFLRLAGLAD